MKKNTTYLIALILCAITGLSIPSLILFGVINPGFEGAKCYGYGASFNFNEDWTGTYALHKYQDAENLLVYHSGGEGLGTRIDKIWWGSYATPNDIVLCRTSTLRYLSGQESIKAYPYLGIHVESNIQLQDINRQGDPLGWNDTNPMDAQRIEYWSKTAVKEETTDKVLYHYTLTKESFLIVPAEFWVGFYLVPSQTNAGTGSGWCEGEWSNIVVWCMLDWTVWDNAYKDPWLDDPKINVFTSEHEGQVISEQRNWEYRGGFPVTGWIQGWEKAGWTSAPAYQESPLWYDTRSSESNVYTIEELEDLKDILMAKCSFTPSLVGQFISLYNEPSASFDYEPQLYEGSTFPTDTVTDYVKTPDSRMKKTMYFPINILNFGTYADPTRYTGPWPTEWRIFYPSCYFRMRVLYGVYGSFTYLWTEELAKDPTVKYPAEPERHGTSIIHVEGFDLGTWLQGIITNPFTYLWTFLIGGFAILVTLIVLAIFAPGFLNVLGGLVGRKKGSARG
jgi:hypothetical protein